MREVGKESVYNKSEDFRRKYFVFYKIFIGCLWFIFSQIAIYFAQSNDDESMEKIE